MTREEFITAAEIAFERLMTQTRGIHPALMEQPMAEGKWSFKELTAHLIIRDELAIRALEAVQQEVSFDWEPYSNFDATNARAMARLRESPLKRVLSELRVTHSTVIEAVRRVSEDKLCENGHVPAWLLSNVTLHYEHHRPEVEEWAAKAKRNAERLKI